MKKEFKIEVTLVSSGTYALYNAYLPGGKHKARLEQKIEDVFLSIDEQPFPKGRYYLKLEMGGSMEDDAGEECDFQMPTVKYCFAKP